MQVPLIPEAVAVQEALASRADAMTSAALLQRAKRLLGSATVCIVAALVLACIAIAFPWVHYNIGTADYWVFPQGQKVQVCQNGPMFDDGDDCSEMSISSAFSQLVGSGSTSQFQGSNIAAYVLNILVILFCLLGFLSIVGLYSRVKQAANNAAFTAVMPTFVPYAVAWTLRPWAPVIFLILNSLFALLCWIQYTILAHRFAEQITNTYSVSMATGWVLMIVAGALNSAASWMVRAAARRVNWAEYQARNAAQHAANASYAAGAAAMYTPIPAGYATAPAYNAGPQVMIASAPGYAPQYGAPPRV